MIAVAVFVISLICSIRGEDLELIDLVHSTMLDAGGKYHLSWNFNESHILFEVQVKTRGWVGLGFSYNGGMSGADIVMGWINDNTGETVLQDRHATNRSVPLMDIDQNYTIFSSFQNDTHTMLRFIRRLDLCEPDDFKITEDTIRVIWAYNDMEPAPGMRPSYHGADRGVKSIILLNPQKSTPPMPANILTLDLFNRNVTIPDDQDTTYWCRSFEIPKLDRKHHFIKMEPIIQPGREAEVHHIVLYACRHENNASVGVEHECYRRNMPREWFRCNSAIMAWAVGGGDFHLPAHVGLPLGDNAPDTPTMFLMETHYDNPRFKSGMKDSSGLRLTLTPDLRQYDAGMVDMGVNVNEEQVIPPYSKDFLSEGLCTETCLRQAMGNRTDAVNIFAVMLHSHTAGSKLRLRHFRNGVELKPITEDNNYDFNLQEGRILPTERILRKGDHTLMQCHYNTLNRSMLTFGGLGTREEMCIAFVLYYPKIPLAYCTSGPVLQYHLAFVNATVDDEENILTPEQFKGEDWKSFLQREVDWKNEQERKRFQEWSLAKNIPVHFHMCFATPTYHPVSFTMVSMPSIDFPWKGNASMCMTTGATQQTVNIFTLCLITAVTSLTSYKQIF